MLCSNPFLVIRCKELTTAPLLMLGKIGVEEGTTEDEMDESLNSELDERIWNLQEL